MTALRQEALSLMEQLPEEQMSNIIQYINTLRVRTVSADRKEDEEISSKMKAFQELVDTNVALDFLTMRQPFYETEKILKNKGVIRKWKVTSRNSSNLW